MFLPEEVGDEAAAESLLSGTVIHMIWFSFDLRMEYIYICNSIFEYYCFQICLDWIFIILTTFFIVFNRGLFVIIFKINPIHFLIHLIDWKYFSIHFHSFKLLVFVFENMIPFKSIPFSLMNGSEEKEIRNTEEEEEEEMERKKMIINFYGNFLSLKK